MEKNTEFFGELEEKAARICNAAVKIFYRKCFDRTTVSEIAASAQVGKGTFYLYFNSKEELLNYLIEYGINRLIKYVSEKIRSIKDPHKKLEMAIDAQLDFFNAHQEYFSFFIREIWSYREGLKEQIFNLKENYIRIFEEIIKEGIEANKLVAVNAETVSSGIFGFVSLASFHWILFLKEFPVASIDQDIKKVFFEGILKDKE